MCISQYYTLYYVYLFLIYYIYINIDIFNVISIQQSIGGEEPYRYYNPYRAIKISGLHVNDNTSDANPNPGVNVDFIDINSDISNVEIDELKLSHNIQMLLVVEIN